MWMVGAVRVCAGQEGVTGKYLSLGEGRKCAVKLVRRVLVLSQGMHRATVRECIGRQMGGYVQTVPIVGIRRLSRRFRCLPASCGLLALDGALGKGPVHADRLLKEQPTYRTKTTVIISGTRRCIPKTAQCRAELLCNAPVHPGTRATFVAQSSHTLLLL